MVDATESLNMGILSWCAGLQEFQLYVVSFCLFSQYNRYERWLVIHFSALEYPCLVIARFSTRMPVVLANPNRP
jgi:hypothetical protein